MDTPDLQLLLAMHKGNGPAAEALWARFSPRMLAYAAAILRRHDDAHDVVQAVFLSLLSRPRSDLKQVRDVAAWLLMLTRSAALNHLRAARRARARDARADAPPRSPAPDPDTDSIRAALERLARRDREIIILKHAAGLTFDQIALALQLNRSTAASRYRAAIERLRAIVEPRGADHRPLLAGCSHE
jgi:RNA polymerase sigma-70 factor, ECF subfamily